MKKKLVPVKLVFLGILLLNIVLEYNHITVYPSISFPKFKYKKELSSSKTVSNGSDSLQIQSAKLLDLIKPFDKRFYLFYRQGNQNGLNSVRSEQQLMNYKKHFGLE